QQTEECYAKEGKHDLINRLRVLLMGLPHHIRMTDLPVPTEDGIPPTQRRFTPIPESHHPAFQCSDAINEQSLLKPEPDEPVGFCPRLTERTGACGAFGAEFITMVHPPAPLSQIPRVGFIAEDILPQKIVHTALFGPNIEKLLYAATRGCME